MNLHCQVRIQSRSIPTLAKVICQNLRGVGQFFSLQVIGYLYQSSWIGKPD
ncbi:hypothetical protein I79_024218 [Cricetulus griseus]|uniref:Uncharacterized protein n=1 Tax=Cricetulus griseus TaxID=10029 RepID=G3IK26_CRIGR|nr:hypothetical protein I79_024218 [Cricetulus griseus]